MRPSQLRCQVTGEQVAPQREPYELRGSRPVLRGCGVKFPRATRPGLKAAFRHSGSRTILSSRPLTFLGLAVVGAWLLSDRARRGKMRTINPNGTS